MIEIENLTKQFGERTVLEDVSLSVDSGEILAVVGPSGAGKSTLSRCVSFLERPTSGTVRVDGQDLTRLEGAELLAARRRIGVIFQSAPLLRRRTVAQNVALPMEYLHATSESIDKRVTELLERVGLADRRDYYPAQLSGGQKQRVGIARALANDPDIMLWDEPFSGLDPLIRREMQDELVRLQREMQKTIVFVTHDLDEAIRLGDRMAVMKGGQFVQVGPPWEIVHNPVNEYVRRFVQARSQVVPEDVGAYTDALLPANVHSAAAGQGVAAGGADGTAGSHAASGRGIAGRGPVGHPGRASHGCAAAPRTEGRPASRVSQGA